MSLFASQVAAAAGVRFRSGKEVHRWFSERTGSGFIDWFNNNCARKQHWAGQAIGTAASVEGNFDCVWNNVPLIFGKETINLIEFSSLTSILINEVGAALAPTTELSGLPGTPGLAYCFNAIPGLKRSYNSGPCNCLAGSLFFDDELYWSAHGGRSLGNEVRHRPELKQIWNGFTYPQDHFPTSLDPAVTAFVQEADFFKFRGRGFIQTTWRTNYAKIVAFIQTLTSADVSLLHYRTLWTDKTPEWVCTTSTNADWDRLFNDKEKLIASRAIGLHNEASGHYLTLATDSAVLSAYQADSGSLYRMGLRVSGGSAYAALFRDRVIQFINTLPL